MVIAVIDTLAVTTPFAQYHPDPRPDGSPATVTAHQRTQTGIFFIVTALWWWWRDPWIRWCFFPPWPLETTCFFIICFLVFDEVFSVDLIKAISGAMIWGRLFPCYPPLRNAIIKRSLAAVSGFRLATNRLAVGYNQKEIRRTYRWHHVHSRIDRFIDCCICYCCGLVEWKSSHESERLPVSIIKMQSNDMALYTATRMLKWDSRGNILVLYVKKLDQRQRQVHLIEFRWTGIKFFLSRSIISTPTSLKAKVPG